MAGKSRATSCPCVRHSQSPSRSKPCSRVSRKTTRKGIRYDENVLFRPAGDGLVQLHLSELGVGFVSGEIFRVQSPAGETTAAPGPTHPKRCSTEHRRAEREGAVLCRRHRSRRQVGARRNIRKIEPGSDSNEPAGFG